MTKHAFVLALAAGLWAAPAYAQSVPASNDYSDPATWLCRPGGNDACAIDNATTVIAADGTLTRESWAADPNAPIDCFYVYPTVSTDQTPFSDMTADPAERNVIRQQFARFASVCRPYAPLYRQMTLAGLRSRLAGGATSINEPLNYLDVRDAWRHYLEHDNQGRGVVLIGHSQGSSLLRQLIAEEIDGTPVQDRLVSAILTGMTIPVRSNGSLGGAFQHIPVCESASDTGCLISFASFRSNLPPPPTALFGRVAEPGLMAACTNPSELLGKDGDLRSYLSAGGTSIVGNSPAPPWVTPAREITTPFVSVPGLITARCVRADDDHYLEITVHGDPSDPRVDDIVGDLGSPENPNRDWGLHLVDMNLTMGDLVEIVDRQAEAYLRR